MELEVLLHAVDVVEDIGDDPGDDALEVRPAQHALHRVGFARGRLAIGEDGAVVAHEYICGEREKRVSMVMEVFQGEGEER